MGSLTSHVKRCVELGHTAVASTEHGTCRGFVALDAACAKEKIKPIFGVEAYVCQDHMRKALTAEQVDAVTAGLSKTEKKDAKAGLEKVEGIHERRHLVLLAENDEGLRNLIKLQNRANTHGFYHHPRIDLDLLEQYNEGLIVNSGCIGGVLAKSFFDGDIDRVLDDLEWFVDVFGDRFSLEIQPHPIDMQEDWNRFAAKLSKAYGVPLVAANDSHYPHPDDWRAHDTLVCVGTGRKVADCERLKYEAETFGLKTGDDMLEAFARVHPDLPRKVVEAAIERSAELAERCNAKLWKPSGVLLPKIEHKTALGAVKSSDKALEDLCVKGWSWRGVKPGDKVYTERLFHELDVIEDKGFEDYFLIVHEMLTWARMKGILTGPGRGSAAGSLVCYLLGITSIDPIEHGLLFERFLTPGRVDWPDIDCDVEDRRRGEVLQHLRDEYGDDCVAQISTISRMRARAAFKDVAKAHGIATSEVERLTTAIVDEKTRIDPGEAHEALKNAVATTPALQEFESRYPEVIAHATRLEGNMRHAGIHPSGVVATPTPLAEFVPLERRKQSGTGNIILVTAYDMRDCETVGLIKLDLLGLKMLSVVADTTRLVNKRHGLNLDLERLPTDKMEVLDAFTEQDFTGVFQFDTAAARGACADVVFETFGDITAMNALNRPGPSKSGLADTWRKRKKSGKWKSGHPTIEKICADTIGVIVYQEHVIRILQELAGYSAVEAGRLRKAISKSKGVGYLEDERPTFVAGAVKSGMDTADAESLWTQIEEFGAYGFNKCVSGDTICLRAGVNKHQGREVTVERLFEIQSEASPIGDKFRSGRCRILQMDDDGRIRPGFVKAVHENGVKKLWEITTLGGRSIKVTGKHKLLTSNGYTIAAEIEAKYNHLDAVQLVCADGIGESEKYWKNPGWVDRRTVLKADHQKGERKLAWSKGKPTCLDPVRRVERFAAQMTYDVEMATVGHNYVANGIISHNSHAAAYALIAYWGQYLKITYPTEFFCGLLMNEQKVAKANAYVRDASRRGVRICPPDINASKTLWTVRGDALLVGIEAIKKCGTRVCEEIEKTAPFEDFPDFVTRINRRVVNKGVIEALIKAGAMKGLMPNTGFALENYERILKKVGQKIWADKTNAELEESKSLPDLDEVDLWCHRLSVGVNGDGRHPLGAVADLFTGYLRPGFVDFEDAANGSWVTGVIVDTKVGTARGERWAAAEVEDENGVKIKVKFNDAHFQKHRAVLDKGAGTLVAMNIAVNKYGGVKPIVFVDLLDLRSRRQNSLELLSEQRILTSVGHPVKSAKRSDWWRDRDCHVLILDVNARKDKNGSSYAFVRVDPGVGETQEVVVFASVFKDCRRYLKEGSVLNVRAKKEKNGNLLAKSINKVRSL